MFFKHSLQLFFLLHLVKESTCAFISNADKEQVANNNAIIVVISYVYNLTAKVLLSLQKTKKLGHKA